MAHQGGRPRKDIQIQIDPSKKYYTVPEVCRLTGMHPETVRLRLQSGELQGKKLGNRWKIYPESLVYVKVDPDLNIEQEVTD